MMASFATRLVLIGLLLLINHTGGENVLPRRTDMIDESIQMMSAEQHELSRQGNDDLIERDEHNLVPNDVVVPQSRESDIDDGKPYGQQYRHEPKRERIAHPPDETGAYKVQAQALRSETLLENMRKSPAFGVNPFDAFNEASAYQEGETLKRNLTRALELYIVAGEAGIVPAMRKAALLLNDDRFLLANPTQAVNWFEQAAEAGDSQAAYELGKMLLSGRGVPRRDFSRAAIWLERAARQTDGSSSNSSAELLFMLGLMHLRGGEVDQNDAVARSLLKRASDLGHGGAERQLDILEEIIEGTNRGDSMERIIDENAADDPAILFQRKAQLGEAQRRAVHAAQRKQHSTADDF